MQLLKNKKQDVKGFLQELKANRTNKSSGNFSEVSKDNKSRGSNLQRSSNKINGQQNQQQMFDPPKPTIYRNPSEQQAVSVSYQNSQQKGRTTMEKQNRLGDFPDHHQRMYESVVVPFQRDKRFGDSTEHLQQSQMQMQTNNGMKLSDSRNQSYPGQFYSQSNESMPIENNHYLATPQIYQHSDERYMNQLENQDFIPQDSFSRTNAFTPRPHQGYYHHQDYSQYRQSPNQQITQGISQDSRGYHHRALQEEHSIDRRNYESSQNKNRHRSMDYGMRSSDRQKVELKTSRALSQTESQYKNKNSQIKQRGLMNDDQEGFQESTRIDPWMNYSQVSQYRQMEQITEEILSSSQNSSPYKIDRLNSQMSSMNGFFAQDQGQLSQFRAPKRQINCRELESNEPTDLQRQSKVNTAVKKFEMKIIESHLEALMKSNKLIEQISWRLSEIQAEKQDKNGKFLKFLKISLKHLKPIQAAQPLII